MVDQAAARPVPKVSVYVDTTPFWEAAKRGKLVLQFCKDTNQFQHYPRPVSIFTGSRNLEWREVSGKGVIYACTVIRVPGPGLEGAYRYPSRRSNWMKGSGCSVTSSAQIRTGSRSASASK